MFICTIDVEKAFNILPRSQIWQCISKKAYSNELILVIKSTYEERKRELPKLFKHRNAIGREAY